LPFTLLHRNKHVIKLYQKKRGIKNPERFFQKILTDRRNSTVIWQVDVFMCILIGLISFSCINFLSALLGEIIATNKFVFVSILLVPSLVINYYLLWKKDKYLLYFKEFDKEPKEVKRKWGWISFGVVIGIIGLLIFSFWVMTKGIH
jgi:hypothetical protein